MDRGEFLYGDFVSQFNFLPTSDQDALLHKVATFIVSGDSDILVINGYAGTGKTTAIAAVTKSLRELKIHSVLLAPTGRAAKVLSNYTGRPAFTIHKHIYRAKGFKEGGWGDFSLAPNKAKDTLFVVDEASLIGTDNNLLEDLVSFVRNGADCKLILIGDSAQLPPVGMEESPALYMDYMAGFGGVEFASLREVVRQQLESGILYNATILRQHIENDDPEDVRLHLPFPDVERIKGGELIEKLQDAYSEYGEDETVVLCRSNKRALRYNAGIRATVQFEEDQLVRGDKVMIVKNCYHFVDDVEGMDYIANGDMAKIVGSPKHFEERYGLHFADVSLAFPDYGDQEIDVKVIMDALQSETASISSEQQEALFNGVMEDYADLSTKKKRYDAVKEDKYYNALQLKYANAITCHKSQGGQWDCVFIDNPFWMDELTTDDLKWMYTAITRAVKKVYLVNFKDEFFDDGKTTESI
ncbi:MAG: AAA family ATPase [Bacteroidales bacterium]|nr:AAA family ATPase [Bacteroidales bacterium]